MTPGLMIAAPRSGSGKTTLTLGLLRALTRGGLKVGSAKCGPDYIDGAFHRVATGRASVNLDSWAMPPALMAGLAAEVGAGADLVVTEALMGLFDGVPGPAGRTGSSADVAAALGWPVLLVLDASGQSQSAAAVAKGCATYDPRIRIAGVVLNRLGSPRHARLAGEAITALGIPVVGTMPRSDAVALPERHLGLVQAGETGDLERRLDAMADFIADNCDIAAIQLLAGEGKAPPDESGQAIAPPGQRIAVARDQAFSFLYPHVLNGWRVQGAEVSFFSPLADEAPDDGADACWLPGGYPELHAGRLAGASRFLDGLRRFAETRRIHGECGGYMVLGNMLTDAEGTSHAMAGLLDVSTSFAKRKLHLGYREASLVGVSCLGSAGTRLRGHEFHYASVTDPGRDEPLAMVVDAYGSEPAPTGSRRGAVSGSFFHVIASVP
ncbi:MAG TPA: cobyrinate a,c-diamide synthase [Alphaproteobacteria bacterium]|jgi:cobyrinic acid a,c-diamide synthase|nr:cobyrinate a,c-diamide synthase [Alphaproteobacteria bacterium]